jgi:AcrR family transcriptional regulator
MARQNGGGRRRPERQARASLSRERIVEAGIALADEEGLEALTLRRLAVVLGAKPMSIYTYVDDKESLLDAMYSRLLERLGNYPPAGTWQGELHTAARAIAAFFTEHPNLLPLLLRPAPPRVVAHIFERLITGMTAAGFEPAAAMRALRTVVSYAVGHVLLDTSLMKGGQGAPELRQRFLHSLVTELSPKDFPALLSFGERSKDEPWDGPKVFEMGLRALVTGIEREYGQRKEPAPDAPAAASRSRRGRAGTGAASG